MNKIQLIEKCIQLKGEDKYIAEHVSHDVHNLLTDIAESGRITIHPEYDEVEISIAVQKIVLNILRELAQSKQKKIQRITRKDMGVERNIDPDL